MQRIVVFEEKAYMMQRIKNLLVDKDVKVFEANNYDQLNNLLGLDLLDADMIIAELDFTSPVETQLIANYLDNHPHTTFIVYTSELNKKTFLKGINIGASDYILHSLPDEELKKRIHKHLKKVDYSILPINVILNLKRYISGEIQKADKGNYKLTITFSSLYDANDNEISKDDTSIISKYFSNSYWDTDSLVIYGNNHFLSLFPFCNNETISLVEKKMQHLIAEVKSKHLYMAKYNMKNTYATFPEEGLSTDDILIIIERKIEKMIEQI